MRPDAWTPPEPEGRYNLVVVGGGTAGLVCAMGAAGLGARVALVESHLLGGDCLNTGCVPSKALLAAAKVAQQARGATRFGVQIDTVEVDFPAVMSRMREIRAAIAPHDSAKRFSEAGVDVFFGQGRFVAPDALEVDGRRLPFARAVIATGAAPFVPAIPGLQESGYLTSESVFDLQKLPPRLAVIGAGPIGCEMAQALRRFGSEVTVVSLDRRILPGDDPDATEVVHRALKREGIRFMLGVEVERVEGNRLIVGGGPEIEADALLVATGRRPNVDGLGLGAADVAYSASGIQVDDGLRTTNRRIYAAGDVTGHYQFTHAADAMARIVIQNALFFGRRRVSDLVMSWCTYTDPEVAHVGATRDSLKGTPFATRDVPLAGLDRARTDGLEAGFLRLLTAQDGLLVGGTVVGPHAGDLATVISTAMAGGMKVTDLAQLVLPYPTLGEAFRRAGDQANKDRLTPLVSSLLKRLLAMRR